MNLQQYVEAKSRLDKSRVVQQIVALCRASNPENGAFVKMNFASGRWMTVADDAAREKVSHAFRDALSVCRPTPGQQQHQGQSQQAKDKKKALVVAQQHIFQSLELFSTSSRSGDNNGPTSAVARGA